LAQATSIDVGGSPQIHTLSSAGDIDFVSFEAVEGFEYIIETFDLGSDVDIVIRLLDEDGDELATDDDSSGDPASRLEWIAHQDGIYYVVVEQQGGAAQVPSSSRGPGLAAPVLAPQRLKGDVRAYSIRITPDIRYALVATGNSRADVVIIDLRPGATFAKQTPVNLPSQVR